MSATLHLRLNRRNTTQLTLLHDTGNQCSWKTYPVFSGAGEHRNNPDSTHLRDAGPIPLGRYHVVDRPTGGRQDWIRSNVYDFDGRGEWFALFRIDGRINDYTVIDGVRRGNFRMHPGSISVGCVTFVDSADFTEAREILLAGSTTAVPGTSFSSYGILTVE